jgi:RNA polymerase sigma-70 factor (ECF subfamily)
MEGTLSLESLDMVARVRAGDVDAFAAIVLQFQSRIVQYLYRLTGDEELARDLAQDTFVQAYKGITKRPPDFSLKAWLYRIATNNALQYIRRRALVCFVPLSGDSMLDAEGDVAEKAGEATAVHEALLKVPEKLRVCMVLHLVDGFRHREIAEMLGISEDAVRMRVARGNEEFRRQYAASGGDSQ